MGLEQINFSPDVRSQLSVIAAYPLEPNPTTNMPAQLSAIQSIVPFARQIVDTFESQVDSEFERGMFESHEEGLYYSMRVLDVLGKVIGLKNAASNGVDYNDVTGIDPDMKEHVLEYFDDDFIAVCGAEVSRIVLDIFDPNIAPSDDALVLLNCSDTVSDWFDLQQATRLLDPNERASLFADSDPVTYISGRVVPMGPHRATDKDYYIRRSNSIKETLNNYVFNGFITPQEAMAILLKTRDISSNTSAHEWHAAVRAGAIARLNVKARRNYKSMSLNDYDFAKVLNDDLMFYPLV